MTWLLLATVLFASVLPCPEPAGPPAPERAPAAALGHVHGTEVDVAHAASLRAPCHCGCKNAPRADASVSRLPLALLIAAPASPAAELEPLPGGSSHELTDTPVPRIDHVPRLALA